jgi:hypothetical protein
MISRHTVAHFQVRKPIPGCRKQKLGGLRLSSVHAAVFEQAGEVFDIRD